MLDLFSAFGLAGSAGLNAYIPLLLVALAARFPLNNPLLNLSEPYSVMGSWWAIGIIGILLIIEMLVDKVPAIDTVNDVIQTFVRPAAGAVLFAANAQIVTDIHPILALGAGLLVAGGVHVVKGVARPVVTATTAGTGNWLVSLVEDIVAFFTSILAIFLPILGVILLGFILFYGIRLYQRRRRRTALR
ncbi:MAG: DUF4126 domain-containing protein [Ardenticatenaceae bacterium]|nr:DUF4126 domain-containing protein [Anaerolineales bacterium]MCB8939653.1 DUF4126 domain-containing protein [Ardenticatenaceae bacterium]MCB8974922.1 DUF4126 domain-containing protein [Ardenticatenaceae bacterium]